MKKILFAALLLSLVLVLLFSTTAFADIIEEPVEAQIVEAPKEEKTIPEDAADLNSAQGVPSVAVDNVETEGITENMPDGSSGGKYYLKFTQTTDEGEKTCQFFGGSEEGISVREILNALQLEYDINENSVIDVDEDSVDTAVIGVRRTDTDIFITDQGMFNKADKDLVITVNGEKISLMVYDDITFLYPVYKDGNDVTKGINAWFIGSAPALEVSDSSKPVTWGSDGESTWYAVTNAKKTVTLSQGVTCKGNVNLILCDGAKLKVNASINNAGIDVSGGNNSLTIYAQSTGKNTGELIVVGGYDGAVGIGGFNGAGSNITINGGTVTATGGDLAAGIGGGFESSASYITINAGTVIATGGENGAGIGGGDNGSASNITINGGTVTATGGKYGAGIGGGGNGDASNITINDGIITATGGYYGAGIGGGDNGSASNITINGGTVTATSNSLGAGIGGGKAGVSYITINGGTVTATGSEYGAGIGGGYESSASYITINDGTVTATGGKNGAGIGGGFRGGASYITINGGTVTATGGENGAGVGGGNGGAASNTTISGGTVTATGGKNGAGIGGGNGGAASYITISGGTVTATGTSSSGIGAGGEDAVVSNIYVAETLSVLVGDNYSEDMSYIYHEDNMDLAEIEDFLANPCILIQPIRITYSGTNIRLFLKIINLNSLSAAQQAAIGQFIEKNDLKLINVLKVINDGGPINNVQEKVNIPIDLKELGVDSKTDINDLRIFQLNEDSTLSQVPFTRDHDKRKLRLEVRSNVAFLVVAEKNK